MPPSPPSTICLERLDRALISSDWQSIFPHSTLRALPRSRSDHSPLMLIAFSFIPASQLFRFEPYLLRHPVISEVISTSWSAACNSDNPASRFASKVGKVSNALKVWSAGLSLALRCQANLCLDWICWIDRAEELRPL